MLATNLRLVASVCFRRADKGAWACQATLTRASVQKSSLLIGLRAYCCADLPRSAPLEIGIKRNPFGLHKPLGVGALPDDLYCRSDMGFLRSKF